MAYIGNAPVLQTTQFRDEFFPTSNQTAFTTGGFHPSSVNVTRNGVLLSEDDYVKGSDNVTITLNNAAVSGDVIVIEGNRSLAQGVSVSESRVEYTWQSGDTAVQLNADVIPAYTDVYLNGVKLAAADYSINASTKQVSFTSAPAIGDIIAVVHKNEASALVALPLKDSSGAEILSESGSTVTLANVDTATIGSNALVVDASGNVGVGTSSPQAKIHANAGSSQVAIMAGGSVSDPSYPAFGFDGQVASNGGRGAGMYLPSDGTLAWCTAATERMRIASDGSMTIGGTISGVPLGVYGNATWCAVFRDSGGTDRHYFYANGVTSNSSGTFGTISDERLKENIKDAAPKLSDIMRLRVVNYNLIDDPNKQLGFLAQEFEQVFPSLVFETDTRQYDEDGNLTKGLADQKIIKAGLDFAILTKAIQEQQTIIESQQSQIDALTARIEALEATP